MLYKQNLFGGGSTSAGGDRYRRDTPPASPAAPQTGAPQPPAASGTEAAKTAPAEAAKPKDETRGSRLIVGPDIKLKGAEITDCDTLVVEGRVEASMDSRVIQIAENGAFIGTVGIDIAEIHGKFEGELTARKQLVIRSTGRVSGKIRYGKLVVEEGGELCGDIATLSQSGMGGGSATSSTSGAQPGQQAKPASSPSLQPAAR
ncbi:MAG: polymer-forming cytoskeletal protein [Burkholderiales bacterium]|nr:polymer-forming cytoskeletal protein [Burkholderiales bacterium]